jgi:hypothetical protein
MERGQTSRKGRWKGGQEGMVDDERGDVREKMKGGQVGRICGKEDKQVRGVDKKVEKLDR